MIDLYLLNRLVTRLQEVYLNLRQIQLQIDSLPDHLMEQYLCMLLFFSDLDSEEHVVSLFPAQEANSYL